jgi:hypothetical protein
MISFFPRQTVMGSAAASGLLYSSIYDVSDASALNVEFRVFTMSGAAVTGIIEETDDPSFVETFNQLGGSLIRTSVGTSPSGLASPKRFVRAKVVIAQDTFAMVHFEGRGL